MGVGEQAANALALIVHELATNSLKYGALSAESGTLDVSCSAHDTELVIAWTEQGGPPVRPPEGPGGYGSQMVARAMARQLDGAIERDWAEQGLVVRLRMNKERVAQ